MDILEIINNNTVYKVKSGSRSYGLDTPESDEDVLGVFMPRPQDILGVVDNVGKHHRRTEIDENYKIIGDFLGCAMDGSSFWVEPLFVREEDILVLDPHFEPFLQQRKMFLTKSLVTKSLGFMTGMINRSNSQKSIPSTNTLSEDEQIEALNKSKRKNVCHAVRVGNMIVEMLDEFDLRVYRPDEREMLLNIKSGTTSIEDGKDCVKELISKIEERLLTSTLPDKADDKILNSLVSDNIVKYWKYKKWI